MPLSTARATVPEHDVRGRLAFHALCRAIEYSSGDPIRIVVQDANAPEDAIRAKSPKEEGP